MVAEPWRTLKRNLNSANIWSLVLICGVVIGGKTTLDNNRGFSLYNGTQTEKAKETLAGKTFFEDAGAVKSISSDEEKENKRINTEKDGTIVGYGAPEGEEESGIRIYKSKKGDTISEIAARFGVSKETILWANPELKTLLHSGEKLFILPVEGILYETKEEDSIELIASRHKTTASAIKAYNQNYQKLIENPGSRLILPYASPSVNGNEPSIRESTF
ncbi:hypothetical protein A3A21_03905 [Candidatus Jorgensenbacteria bacterium RIFCSPLOWO2_01_FULL_45_25b]|uniref:LysM domain-containing protein n=1 Tax=Candidatus Jorgensenbacteria bacterium RIFCSPLOWO2_01_FULL_45_25b TaxID=1798471 RepID=A0A1F6BWG7_9BACT|nr:MAG: hypothetical protein A3A21_03905 [Candidatus Jorgensenbacteria bacterium RIFCSPLOWO2_01_FULL_45_25b]